MILALTVRGVLKKDHLSTLAWQNQGISSNLAIAGNWRQNSLLSRVWLCAGFAFCKRVLGLRGLTTWITEHPDEAFSFIFLCIFYFQVKLGYQPFKELVANASVSISSIES